MENVQAQGKTGKRNGAGAVGSAEEVEEVLFQVQALTDTIRESGAAGLATEDAFVMFSATGFDSGEQFHRCMVAPLVEKGVIAERAGRLYLS